MAVCGSCGKSFGAGYEIQGVPVCTDCAYKMQQINEMGQRSAERAINYLTGEIEAISGVSLNWPRFPEPKPPVHMHSPTLNSLQINDSVVGAVNQGYVESMNVSLSNVNKENQEVAKLVKLFSEYILQAQEIDKEVKEELLQHLSYLIGQLNTPKKKRATKVVKTIIGAIEIIVKAHPILKTMWDKIAPYFGL